MHGFEDSDADKEHLVLTLGDVSDGEPVLARVHSECLTGDALFSMRCDCGEQLQAALMAIAEEGGGVDLHGRVRNRMLYSFVQSAAVRSVAVNVLSESVPP